MKSQIAFSISPDFSLRGKQYENYDVRFLDFSGWENVGFFAGGRYEGKVPNPILGIGDLKRIAKIDYLRTDKSYFVASRKLIDLIDGFQNDEYKVFPVRVYQSDNLDEVHNIDSSDLNEREYSDDFHILQCTNPTDVLNKAKSALTYFDFGFDDEPPAVSDVGHFVFSVDDDRDLPSIFQIPELTQYFVSTTAKETMETHRIQGMIFRELP